MLTTAYVLAWLRALCLTQLVEAPIYRSILGVRWWQALVPTFVTHPFVWFAFPLLRGAGVPYLAWVALAEVSVWLVEAAIVTRLARVRWTRGALASLVANGASLAVGMLVYRWLGAL